MLDRHASGASCADALAYLTARWDENKGHDWCHTISNAEIVAIALLWGAKDYEKTVCLAVMPGSDCMRSDSSCVVLGTSERTGMPSRV